LKYEERRGKYEEPFDGAQDRPFDGAQDREGKIAEVFCN